LFTVTLEGKNPYIYLSRPYFCHEQTPVLGLTVFFSISSKKYLKHFIMKLLGLIVTIDYHPAFEVRMRVPLPVIDWRGHSILLFRYNTGKRRIEWEVWR